MTNNIPVIGSAWYHPTTDNTYRVILVSNITAFPNRRDKYPIIVNYQNVVTQETWGVPLEHWHSKHLVELMQTHISG